MSAKLTPLKTLKNRVWWWLALFALAISTLALAPAALIEWALPQEGSVKFAADSGTLWHGRGRVALGVAGQTLIVPVAWSFDPQALWRFRVGYTLSTASPHVNGTSRVAYGFGELTLTETALDADAGLLPRLHAAASLLSPSGRVALNQTAEERLSLRLPSGGKQDWQVDGRITLNTQQLALGGVVNAAIGSHRAALRGSGSQVDVSISESRGALKLEGAGHVTLSAPRRVVFAGFATLTSDAPNVLKQLGTAMPDGRQRIDINSAW